MGKVIFMVEGKTVGTVAEGRGVKVEYEVSETDSARLIAAMADFHAGDFAHIEGGAEDRGYLQGVV